MSASDACVAFFQKVLRGEIGEPGQGNSKSDGAAFYSEYPSRTLPLRR